MNAPESSELFLAAQRGDETALAELLRRHEPYLRRVIHMRLTDPRLRRLFETMDIYQSVAAHFLERIEEGNGTFASEERMRNYLVTMVVNKIKEKARAAKNRPVGLPAGYEPAAADPSPSQQAAVKDAAVAIRAKLTEEERRLLELRAEGRSWQEIATACGGNADAARIKHSRLIDKLRRQHAREENARE